MPRLAPVQQLIPRQYSFQEQREQAVSPVDALTCTFEQINRQMLQVNLVYNFLIIGNANGLIILTKILLQKTQVE